MRSQITIPEALHCCPGCFEPVAAGQQFCPDCRWKQGSEERAAERAKQRQREEDELRHAARANEVFSRQPRETGRMPEDSSDGPGMASLLAALIVLFYLGWVAYGILRACTWIAAALKHWGL